MSTTLRIASMIALATAAAFASGCGEKTVVPAGDLAMKEKGDILLFIDDDLSTNDDMTVGPDMAMSCGDYVKGNGNTGEACMVDKDCKPGLGISQPGRCLIQTTELGNLTNWDNGYCTSLCDPDLNDPNQFGINPECPGKNATCAGAGPTARCVKLCTAPNNCRGCYSCFQTTGPGNGCLPLAVSQCDPRKTDSCPLSGNTRLTCQDIGYGDVGKCANPCDPFTKMGCPGGAGGKDCHATDTTGLGFCTTGSLSGIGPGGDCVGWPVNECPSGYGCLNGKCWKYCNDGNRATQCIQGARCMPMPSQLAPTSVIGICEQSK